MLDKRKFYIDGKWVEPATQNDLLVLNPATEKPIERDAFRRNRKGDSFFCANQIHHSGR
ncbi:hypothetical protein [Sinorhizobium meliloti]|uniref:hypothetical protein n=1 Tax=Rhizobium meliloti TaxID=382 RepID=UPI00186570C5|nr:hypothetical protein [Sinorhizobium meliloti]MDE3853753.1 hypothetical protein [Sinorhizobium meliloti]